MRQSLLQFNAGLRGGEFWLFAHLACSLSFYLISHLFGGKSQQLAPADLAPEWVPALKYRGKILIYREFYLKYLFYQAGDKPYLKYLFYLEYLVK